MAGFSRDLAGNVGEGDANVAAPDYSDKVSPTVTGFAAVRVNQSDDTLMGWTADEIAALTVAAVGSEGDDDYVPADTTALDAALAQAQAVFGDGYTEIAAGDAKLVDGSFKAGVKIGIQAQMSEIVLEESSIVATLSSGGTATLVAGSIANGATFVQGNSDQLFGIYTVGSDDNSASLNVSSFAAATDGDDTIQTIDVYGNQMTSTAVPQAA